MEQSFIDDGEKFPVLGPSYFAARAIAERVTNGFDPSGFEPIIKKAADEMSVKVCEYIQDAIMSDVESNIQSSIWHQIDGCVRALLSGQKWALDRYVLSVSFDGAAIREAVAKHIPSELQDARVKDLEAEVKSQQETIKFLRR